MGLRQEGTITPLDRQLKAIRLYQAYRILGVHPNDVAMASKITNLIKKNIRPGGIRMALSCLRSSDLDNARRFISVYDDLTLPASVRRLLPIEAFALRAGLTPSELYEVIVQAVRRQSALDGVLIAAKHHPEIVEKSSQLALDGDIAHVTQNLKHMGFLPMPKGAQVAINVSANATSAAQSVSAPSPESTIRKLVGRFNSALPPADPPKALPESTQGEVVPDLRAQRSQTIDAMAPVGRMTQDSEPEYLDEDEDV